MLCRELVPEDFRFGEEVQVVGFGVGGVEVAGGAVGCADVVSGLELLQQNHRATRPGELPRGSRSHGSSANNYNVNLHACSIHRGPLENATPPKEGHLPFCPHSPN